MSSRTYHSVYRHVQQSPRPHYGEYPVYICKDVDHHLVFILWGRSDCKIKDKNS